MGNAQLQLHAASEARELLGHMSRQTLWRLEKRGEIGVVRIGTRVYIESGEIERFIRERTNRSMNDDDEAA